MCFGDAKAYLDRGSDIHQFPRESADQFEELDELSGNFYLIDGQIAAEADEIEVDGQRVFVRALAAPNSGRGRRGSSGEPLDGPTRPQSMWNNLVLLQR